MSVSCRSQQLRIVYEPTIQIFDIICHYLFCPFAFISLSV